jgi:hypothetical protein
MPKKLRRWVWELGDKKSIKIAPKLGIRHSYNTASFDRAWCVYCIMHKENNIGSLDLQVHSGMIYVRLDGKDKVGFDTVHGAFTYIKNNIP